jgi:hypothetical protein
MSIGSYTARFSTECKLGMLDYYNKNIKIYKFYSAFDSQFLQLLFELRLKLANVWIQNVDKPFRIGHSQR